MAAGLISTAAPARRRAWTMRGASRRRLLAATLLVAGVAIGAQAGWIHAKASVAQWLLQNAWAQSLADGDTHAPWPWADTWPVARLQVPGLGIDQIVLAGDSGRTLAFGPGWAPASAAPGAIGTTVVSGHRDTHFAFLRTLLPGDEVRLQSAAGDAVYRVVDTRVADTRSERLPLDEDGETLWLVTCWPFDALTAGGPMRYAVRTVRVDTAATVALR